MKTLLETVVVGDYDKGMCEFHIRLWSDYPPDERYWIDWEVFEVLGVELNGERTRTFWKRGDTASLPGTTDLDEAEPVAEGMVKWDGCTQFTMDAHIDGRTQLEGLFDAVLRARKLAARAMVGKMVNDDYPHD